MMCKTRFRVRDVWMLLPTFMLLVWFGPVGAQGQLVRLGYGAENSMIVPLYKSRIVSLNSPATRISVGNPDIADIVIVRSTQLYVLGKDLGTTNILLWDRDDNLIGTLNIEVSHDLQSLKEKLYRLLPNDRIEVYSAQRNIVLAGQVSSISNMNAAIRIAQGYFAQIAKATESETFELEDLSRRADKSVGEIINLMSVLGVQQVMLEVKVAEIQRSELKELDVQFVAMVTGSSNWDWGAFNGGAPDAPSLIPNNKGFLASFTSNSATFDVAFQALKSNGLAKILAEPTLVTVSGHESKFISGGEFPYQLQGGINGDSISFKEFGIIVGFLPIVLSADRISLKLDIEVSELGPVGEAGPSIIKRGAQSTLELSDGQTIAIAGLIDEKMSETVNKFPGLGSIPILGALFRSQDFQRRETELLILVTPHLVKPLLPSDLQLPTDNIVGPSDFGWFFMGRLQGRAIAAGGSKVEPRQFVHNAEKGIER